MSINRSQRVGSAGSRAGSASKENLMLRNTISQLQEELTITRAEAKRVSHQLSCVMMLVKKTWQGDKAAASHLANIICAAPPDVQPTSESSKPVIIPKSRALNNWAVLTIGLLNREYKALERELQYDVNSRLRIRRDFLDEQLLLHRDQQIKQGNGLALKHQTSPPEHVDLSSYSATELGDPMGDGHVHFRLSKPVSYSGTAQNHGNGYVDSEGYYDQERVFLTRGAPTPVPPKQMISADQVPADDASRKKPAIRHLYRPASKTTVGRAACNVDDLFVEPGSKQTTDQVMDGLYHMDPIPAESNPLNNRMREEELYEEDPDRQFIPYDHPARYATNGLFDADRILGPDSAHARRVRPFSGKHQRETDTLRARPKSGVAGRPGRQIAYEATRPVSAKKPLRATSAALCSTVQGMAGSRRVKSATSLLTPSVSPMKQQQQVRVTQNVNNCEEPSLVGPDMATHSGRQSMVPQNSCHPNHNPELSLHLNSLDAEENEEEENIEDADDVASTSQLEPPMTINIQKPASVLQFEKDLNAMAQLENKFKENTISLQKKLGIEPGAMVF